jgi:uncharacterized protein YbjQ (UPF0145 family)
MEIYKIAQKFGINEVDFETWLNKSGYKIKRGFLSDLAVIDDSLNPNDLVTAFKQQLADKQDRLEKEKEIALIADREKKQATASMLITSGFNFDGHTITRYSGYISGDSAMSLDRPTQGWFGGVNKDVGNELLTGLANMRRKALEELKEAAYALGCNAVIGVDFDYLTMDPETATKGGGTLYLPFLFAVTANGNAVVIEKN